VHFDAQILSLVLKEIITLRTPAKIFKTSGDQIPIFVTRNLNGTKTDCYVRDLCVGQKRHVDSSEFHPSACTRNGNVNALARRNADSF
jgi:hypothetical protein